MTTKNPKKLSRPLEGRKIAGVCLAFANYFNIDVTLVRLLFAFMFIVGGSGFIFYLVSWILIPESN
jgi:phage shock protein C